MLFRSEARDNSEYVALATYTDEQVAELLHQFQENFTEASNSVDWQSEKLSLIHWLAVVAAVLLGIAVIVGFYFEF